MDYQYTVCFEPLEEGGYNVIVPAIPEIRTFGSTIEEAREMAKDAIRCVIESVIKNGNPSLRTLIPPRIARVLFSGTGVPARQ
jgi:predicted RNase H-like HicB family nuclease